MIVIRASIGAIKVSIGAIRAGIGAGWKGIVAIKASMGAGDFKKQGWEWKREELTVKDQRTNYKILSN